MVADVAIEDNEEETIYPTQKKVQTSSLSPSTAKLRNIDYDEYYQEDFSLCEYLLIPFMIHEFTICLTFLMQACFDEKLVFQNKALA